MVSVPSQTPQSSPNVNDVAIRTGREVKISQESLHLFFKTKKGRPRVALFSVNPLITKIEHLR